MISFHLKPYIIYKLQERSYQILQLYIIGKIISNCT